MQTLTQSTIVPLIDSQNDLHLTAYIENGLDKKAIEKQLYSVINSCMDSLGPILSKDELQEFVKPVQDLLHDSAKIIQQSGHLAIFRKPGSLQVLTLSIPVRPLYSLASSFHIKPLLKSLQMSPEYLLVGIRGLTIKLFRCSGTSYELLDAVQFCEASEANDLRIVDKGRVKRLVRPVSYDELVSWLAEWGHRFGGKQATRLYFCGDVPLSKRVIEDLKGVAIFASLAGTEFNDKYLFYHVEKIHMAVQMRSHQEQQKRIVEFYLADERKHCEKNLFRIAYAAVRGQVKQLIVADDHEIFGTLNPKTGALSLHPKDLDHEDDDLLDDIAQTVLRHGGKVVVCPRQNIPGKKMIMAIVDDRK